MGMASARGRTLPRTDLLSSVPRTLLVPRALVVLRVLIAVAIAATVTVLITSRLPRSLDVTTDVVGYPIAANFNVNRYLWVYGIWVAFFPLVALAIDLGLSRLTRDRTPRPSSVREGRPAPEHTASPFDGWAVAVIRTAFVGLVLGLEVAIAAELDGAAFLLALLGMLVLYGAVAGGIAALAAPLRGRRLSLFERLAAVNIFACPLTILGLYDVSDATKMRVLDTGKVYAYPWFPLWLAATLTAVLLVVALIGARSRRERRPAPHAGASVPAPDPRRGPALPRAREASRRGRADRLLPRRGSPSRPGGSPRRGRSPGGT